MTYASAGPLEHVVGALGTILTGLAGGYLAAWITRRNPLAHASGVALIVALETTWIVTTRVGSNPGWFDLAGGLTLMVTAVLGAWLCARQTAPRARPAVA